MAQHRTTPLSKAQGEVETAVSRVSEAAQSARQRGGDYVDEASTSVGRAMQASADGLANRALSASNRMSRAGQYLERNNSADFSRDFGDWIRQHPGVTLGVGLGLGLMLGRALSR
jgi:ElaB/YqjD/DUF883 family membrane-anchored ribosome-binding protein